jgi:hypothetical protein
MKLVAFSRISGMLRITSMINISLSGVLFSIYTAGIAQHSKQL